MLKLCLNLIANWPNEAIEWYWNSISAICSHNDIKPGELVLNLELEDDDNPSPSEKFKIGKRIITTTFPRTSIPKIFIQIYWD